jgi:glutaryl-CoA dehydrogenase
MTDSHTTDLYGLEDDLSDAQRALQLRVRSWVSERFIPLVNDCWDRADFPMDLAREIGALGAYGTSITGYGCPGLDSLSYGLVMRELERGDSGLRTMASVQGALAMNAIAMFGTEEQKQAWLPDMAMGERLGCFGLTEPGFGSNPGGMETRARRSGDDWVLDGEKMWIGNADVSDVAIIWAKVDDAEGAKAIRGFLVPTDAAGFSASLIEGKYSLRVARTARIRLDGVRINRDALLPGTEAGLRAALTCLDQARYGIAWGVLGAAEACLEEAVHHVSERVVFSRPLNAFQMIQGKLADMVSRLTHAQLSAARLAELKDAGRLREEQISMAKYCNVEIAQEIASTCREMLGGVGILDEHVVMRHMINLESVATYEGTSDIHRLVLGRWLTGVQAFQ